MLTPLVTTATGTARAPLLCGVGRVNPGVDATGRGVGMGAPPGPTFSDAAADARDAAAMAADSAAADSSQPKLFVASRRRGPPQAGKV